jgi:hypothetical protein
VGVMTKLAKGTLYARGVRLGSLDGFERVIAGIYGRLYRTSTVDRHILAKEPPFSA